MESYFEWPCAVDLRCAPLGPRLESHLERKLILGPRFVLDSRAALRAYQPPLSEIHSFFENEAQNKMQDEKKENGVVHQRFRLNGVTTELLPPVTRLRIIEIARNVFSLQRSYYGVTPTRDTS